MVLGLVYCLHSLSLGVAGLVNVDLGPRVSGHLRYPLLMGEILRRCGFVGVCAGSDIAKDDMMHIKESERPAVDDPIDAADSIRLPTPDSDSSDESAEGEYAEIALEDDFFD